MAGKEIVTVALEVMLVYDDMDRFKQVFDHEHRQEENVLICGQNVDRNISEWTPDKNSTSPSTYEFILITEDGNSTLCQESKREIRFPKHGYADSGIDLISP